MEQRWMQDARWPIAAAPLPAPPPTLATSISSATPTDEGHNGGAVPDEAIDQKASQPAIDDRGEEEKKETLVESKRTKEEEEQEAIETEATGIEPPLAAARSAHTPLRVRGGPAARHLLRTQCQGMYGYNFSELN